MLFLATFTHQLKECQALSLGKLKVYQSSERIAERKSALRFNVTSRCGGSYAMFYLLGNDCGVYGIKRRRAAWQT